MQAKVTQIKPLECLSWVYWCSSNHAFIALAMRRYTHLHNTGNGLARHSPSTLSVLKDYCWLHLQFNHAPWLLLPNIAIRDHDQCHQTPHQKQYPDMHIFPSYFRVLW